MYDDLFHTIFREFNCSCELIWYHKKLTLNYSTRRIKEEFYNKQVVFGKENKVHKNQQINSIKYTLNTKMFPTI